MNNIAFLKESIKNIKTVGTFTRSSKFLCRGMVKHVDFENAHTIVELGAGDGVITKHILKHKIFATNISNKKIQSDVHGSLLKKKL